MPSINRIRVNNVKYNFGTQYYDDFTMRMYGKNTLYDLANGGGKSVLMLLLMQNMIPNSMRNSRLKSCFVPEMEIQPSILSSNGSWMSRIARKAIAI